MDKNDCMVDVVCSRHGALGRVIVGAAVLCHKCHSWVRAESPEQAQRREKAAARKRRSRAGLAHSLGRANVTLLPHAESSTYKRPSLQERPEPAG
jgi:hypothetical protein